MEEVLVGETLSKHPTIEEVNQNLLDRLNMLIQQADDESIVGLTECVAKYNTSIKGNQIFTPDESAEEKNKRRTTDLVNDILKGGK